MRDYFRKLIKDWVKARYGENEANNPSWDIGVLADALNAKFYDLHFERDLQYVIDDLDSYIENRKIKGLEPSYKLTMRQKRSIARRIVGSDWYERIEPDDFDYYIESEMKRDE